MDTNKSYEVKVLWKDYLLANEFVKSNKTITIGNNKSCKIFAPINPITISKDSSNKIEIDGLTIIKTNNDIDIDKPTKFEFNSIKTLSIIGLSALAHSILFASFALFMPPLGITDDDVSKQDQLLLIQQYLKASAERELEEKKTENVTEDKKADDKEGGTGSRAKNEEGSMGNQNSKDTNKRFGITGPVDNKDIRIARSELLKSAAEFGLIGLLNSGGINSDAPTAIWGNNESLGNDPINARGNMFGSDIGESFGMGGLGLSGVGEGGGGRFESIGVGNIGTIGHGAGTGGNIGFGVGNGLLNKGHQTKVPKVRMGTTVVNGRLPAEIIQRIVRQNYGRYRLCFQNGLKNNPNLQGRVSVRFIIGRDGSVSNVSNNGSDLPDANVINCVTRSFYGLSFPAPENGIVTVVYPIMFSPE